VREVGGAPGLRRRFERLLPGPWTIAVEPLLGSGPARGTALEIELDPQGNAPVVLRP